jgi:hypothetical protein
MCLQRGDSDRCAVGEHAALSLTGMTVCFQPSEGIHSARMRPMASAETSLTEVAAIDVISFWFLTLWTNANG